MADDCKKDDGLLNRLQWIGNQLHKHTQTAEEMLLALHGPLPQGGDLKGNPVVVPPPSINGHMDDLEALANKLGEQLHTLQVGLGRV
jgi:hypothetical protein